MQDNQFLVKKVNGGLANAKWINLGDKIEQLKLGAKIEQLKLN
jgi:hypothetical protein